MRWLWRGTSENSKTGNIPVGWPADLEEAWASCTGCALRDVPARIRREDRRQAPACYFWRGRAHPIARKIAQRAQTHLQQYTLQYALSQRSISARAVRASIGGDSHAANRREYKANRRLAHKMGLAWLDYTHFWRSTGGWLKGLAMASCDTWDDALAAVDAGWRAAVHVPVVAPLQGRYNGIKYTLCPAQREGQKRVQCNECRLCDASRDVVPIIVFINH